jgi:5-methylcytosine-specific restriction endonuclease McrA
VRCSDANVRCRHVNLCCYYCNEKFITKYSLTNHRKKCKRIVSIRKRLKEEADEIKEIQTVINKHKENMELLKHEICTTRLDNDEICEKLLNKMIKENENYAMNWVNENLITNKEEKRHVNGYMKRIVAVEQQWKCIKCKEYLDVAYEIDHIIPINKGGSNQKRNLQALCRKCHGNKTFSDAS